MREDLNEPDGSLYHDDISFVFESLFKKHEKAIYRLALRVTKSHLAAGDIIQEVFLKVWEHRSELRSLQHPDAWIARIAKNKLIDFLRKAATDERVRTAIWKSMETVGATADASLEFKESEEILHKAIEKLPPQRQLVYRLNREAGLSYQQIADELSISRHTVKNQLSNALRFLQKKFSLE